MRPRPLTASDRMRDEHLASRVNGCAGRRARHQSSEPQARGCGTSSRRPPARRGGFSGARHRSTVDYRGKAQTRPIAPPPTGGLDSRPIARGSAGTTSPFPPCRRRWIAASVSDAWPTLCQVSKRSGREWSGALGQRLARLTLHRARAAASPMRSGTYVGTTWRRRRVLTRGAGYHRPAAARDASEAELAIEIAEHDGRRRAGL